VSGIPEIVRDGVNGLLVPPDDAEAMADAVLRLSRDRDLARRIGDGGRETARGELDGDRLAGTLAALFEEVVARPGL
jgi:glycosyltransferase involved in cell wall biosynthesis